MGQSLVKNLIHIIYSTKDRVPRITPAIEDELFKYMTGIVKNYDCNLLAINGVPDHVHLLVDLHSKIALALLMENLKKSSSRWIKTKGRQYADFYWQDGYGAFSVSESGVQQVKAYIQNQKKRHRATTFKEEFVMFLKKYNVPYDERYVWM